MGNRSDDVTACTDMDLRFAAESMLADAASTIAAISICEFAFLPRRPGLALTAIRVPTWISLRAGKLEIDLPKRRAASVVRADAE